MRAQSATIVPGSSVDSLPVPRSLGVASRSKYVTNFGFTAFSEVALVGSWPQASVRPSGPRRQVVPLPAVLGELRLPLRVLVGFPPSRCQALPALPLAFLPELA